MPFRTSITYTADPAEHTRQFGKIVKEVFKESVELWHRKMFPRHFTVRGARKYGFQDRTKRYVRRKRRKKGHNKPWVWSGTLRRVATRRIKITGTAKGATGRISGKRFKNLRASYPDVEKELTITAPDEAQKLAQFVERESARRLKAVRKKRTRRL